MAAIIQPRVGHEAPSLESIQEHCRTSIAGYKLPRRLHVVDVVERSPSGKPDYTWATAIVTCGRCRRPVPLELTDLLAGRALGGGPSPPIFRLAALTMEIQRGVMGDLASFPELAAAAEGRGIVRHRRPTARTAFRRHHLPVVHCTAEFRADRAGTVANTPLHTRRAAPARAPAGGDAGRRAGARARGRGHRLRLRPPPRRVPVHRHHARIPPWSISASGCWW